MDLPDTRMGNMGGGTLRTINTDNGKNPVVRIDIYAKKWVSLTSVSVKLELHDIHLRSSRHCLSKRVAFEMYDMMRYLPPGTLHRQLII